MTEKKEYSICIAPGSEYKHVAGPFDLKTRTPCYEIEVAWPPYDSHKVEVNQVFFGTPENCQWGYVITNKSTYPVFVTFKKNGQKI